MDPRSLYADLMQDPYKRGKLWDLRKEIDMNSDVDINDIRLGSDTVDAFELGVMWALQAEDSDY